VSVVKCRAALEVAVNAMAPVIATAWENTKFSPVVEQPYQRVSILFAEPGNEEYGVNYQELGYMQITLFYPHETGSQAAMARAELIRQTFKRGSSFVNSGLTVVVSRTPEVMPAYNDGERFAVPVKIRFYANTY
jgi:hypothetical protein